MGVVALVRAVFAACDGSASGVAGAVEVASRERSVAEVAVVGVVAAGYGVALGGGGG